MLSQNLPSLVMLTAVVATRAACGDTSSRKVRGKRLRFGCPPFKVITKLAPRTPCSQNHDGLLQSLAVKGFWYRQICNRSRPQRKGRSDYFLGLKLVEG